MLNLNRINEKAILIGASSSEVTKVFETLMAISRSVQTRWIEQWGGNSPRLKRKCLISMRKQIKEIDSAILLKLNSCHLLNVDILSESELFIDYICRIDQMTTVDAITVLNAYHKFIHQDLE